MNSPLPEPLTPDDIVLVYDGVCGLCNSLVQFILRHNRRADIRFTALQSPLGEKIRLWAGVSSEGPGTLIVVEHGRAYSRSTGALRLARYLDWPYPLSYCAIIVPRFIRDVGYNFVARNRYRWFGKHDSCTLPSPELRNRFL